MKRVVLSITIGVLSVLALCLALDGSSVQAAPPPVPCPSPQRQFTVTTFSVSCGATVVAGPCDAACVAVPPSSAKENAAWSTVLSSWPLTGSITGTTPISDFAWFTGDIRWEDGNGLFPEAFETNVTHDLEQGLYGINIDWTHARGNRWAKSGEIELPLDATNAISQVSFYVTCGNCSGEWYECPVQDCPDFPRPYIYPGGNPCTQDEETGHYFTCEPDELEPDEEYYLWWDEWRVCDGVEQCLDDTPPGTNCWTQGYEHYFNFSIYVTEVNGEDASGYFLGGAFCQIAQTINIEGVSVASMLMGTEVKSTDLPPLGLDPFQNGILRLYGPISTTTVYYAWATDEDLPLYGTAEQHTIEWAMIGATLPFSAPIECIPPTIIDPNEFCGPAQIGWSIGEWLAWLDCRMSVRSLNEYNRMQYMLCLLVYKPLGIGFNSMYKVLWGFLNTIDYRMIEMLHLWLSWFLQLKDFLTWYIPALLDCFGNGMVWFATWFVENWPNFVDFFILVVSQGVPWITTLLGWLATDVLAATFGFIADLISTAIQASSSTMQFIVAQFAATLQDAVAMIRFVLAFITMLVDLLSEIITGLGEALDSDTEAELFSELTYFWRGIEAFEDIVADTPLAILNAFAIGLMAIGLVWWTIGQVMGLIDDMADI